MRIITTLILLMCLTCAYAQSDHLPPEKKSFTKTVMKHIKKYSIRSDVAYMDKEYEHAKFLYDSLVEHVVTGTYFDDVRLNSINKGKFFTEDIQVPIVLTTNAAWCVANKGEIPALNDLAHTNKNKLQIIVLLWGRKEQVEQYEETHELTFDENIILAYIDERDNLNARLVESIKHTLGYPTTFFIDQNKKIVGIHKNTELNTTYMDEEKAYLSNRDWYAAKAKNILPLTANDSMMATTNEEDEKED